MPYRNIIGVTDLSPEVDSNLFTELFSQVGPVREVWLNQKAYIGYVEYESEAGVLSALLFLDGIELYGQKLSIFTLNEDDERKDAPIEYLNLLRMLSIQPKDISLDWDRMCEYRRSFKSSHYNSNFENNRNRESNYNSYSRNGRDRMFENGRNFEHQPNTPQKHREDYNNYGRLSENYNQRGFNREYSHRRFNDEYNYRGHNDSNRNYSNQDRDAFHAEPYSREMIETFNAYLSASSAGISSYNFTQNSYVNNLQNYQQNRSWNNDPLYAGQSQHLNYTGAHRHRNDKKENNRSSGSSSRHRPY